MPAEQSGSVSRHGRGWRGVYYDENGKQRRKGGFETKQAARKWAHDHAEEVLAVQRGDRPSGPVERLTVGEIADRFLELHDVDPATTRKMRSDLKQARGKFGDSYPDDLRRIDLEAWRKTLSPGSQHGVFRTFRQLLAWAVDRELATRNASTGIKNPKRKRHERRPVAPFEDWSQVEAVADELDPRYAAIPTFAVGTGLRPEEWIGLHRADIDKDARVVHVRRRYSGRELKDGGKTPGSVRAVPLRQRVLDALEAMPPRIDTPILFAAPRGGYLDIEKFRHREWTPALKAAGIDHRRIYDCRHTFATWAIEAGVEALYLAKIMGTSVRELEDCYFHWLDRTDEQVRGALDAFDVAAAR